jgi:hypothetical protein
VDAFSLFAEPAAALQSRPTLLVYVGADGKLPELADEKLPVPVQK